jgi:hypothetical protein
VHVQAVEASGTEAIDETDSRATIGRHDDAVPVGQKKRDRDAPLRPSRALTTLLKDCICWLLSRLRPWRFHLPNPLYLSLGAKRRQELAPSALAHAPPSDVRLRLRATLCDPARQRATLLDHIK